MTWSTNNNPTNPFSARNMTSQYLTNQTLRAQRDRIYEQSNDYGSTSSSDSSNSSSSYSPALRAQLRRIRERNHELRQRIMGKSNTSNESIFTKLFSSCCGKK